jgi:UDP:flavonoid glycosyltransferase YjiC (YdhE family)
VASFLFVPLDAGGNVNPFLALGEELQARGHTVRAAVPDALRERFVDAGLAVHAHPGPVPSPDDVLAAAAGADLPDVVVVDYMATPALVGARALGRPTVALVHTLYLDLLIGGAPMPMGVVSDIAALNDQRSRHGLASVGGFAELLGEVDLVLVTAPRELDGPGTPPANVRYGGILFQSAGPDTGWSPPPGEDPLVVVSMGTAGQGGSSVLQRVLDALGGSAVRGWVSLPSYVAPNELSVPDNVILSGYVRHAAVMPHADLLVTHAGLGSIGAALTFGVPMVCIPEDRDQPVNAAAVARLGAGQQLFSDASPTAIREAVARGLAGPRPAARPLDHGPACALVEGVLARS